jgi:hypothetical protein
MVKMKSHNHRLINSTSSPCNIDDGRDKGSNVCEHNTNKHPKGPNSKGEKFAVSSKDTRRR